MDVNTKQKLKDYQKKREGLVECIKAMRGPEWQIAQARECLALIDSKIAELEGRAA